MQKEADEYRNEMILTLPNLVRNLKIGILSGDTMENALWNSKEFISGPLQFIIHEMSLQVGGNKSFTDVITDFIAKVDEPDVLAVFQRILSYHVSGIANPKEAFSDMDEHLERIKIDQATAIIEKVQTPLTVLTLAGFLNILIQLGIPTFSHFIAKLFI